MATNIELPDVPIAASVDPDLSIALRQINANNVAIADHLKRDIITFTATSGVETLEHRLGKTPSYFTVLMKDGAGEVYATTANKNEWDKNKIVLTTTTSVNFTLEIT